MAEHEYQYLEHTPAARKALTGYLVVFGVVLLLMMTMGFLMRMTQGGLLGLNPDRFYQTLTVHGTGMVGITGIGGAAIMWYFLGRYVRLSVAVLTFNLVAFVIGAAMILYADFIGGFAAAWTFLWPLPTKSMGLWEPGAAALHLSGLLLIGVGFLLLHLDAGRAIIGKYGNLARALGWPHLFGFSDEKPPKAVVASTMALISNILGLVSGATVLTISIVNLYVPSFTIDPLLAKNLIYFFGHVFINITIYMAIIAVYELLPVYTGREWKVNRVFLASWTVATVLMVAVYPHHLLMDLNMPAWVAASAQVASYISGMPILVVTGYGALVVLFRSKVRWTTTTALLLLGVFGWAAGSLPAIVDATIRVNKVMHNTLWVPGHFHTYLLVGQVSLVFGFMAHFSHGTEWAKATLNRAGVGVFMLGGLMLTQGFLFSGQSSIPRRYAEYLPEWLGQAQFGALAAALVIAGAAILFFSFLIRAPRICKAS